MRGGEGKRGMMGKGRAGGKNECIDREKEGQEDRGRGREGIRGW